MIYGVQQNPSTRNMKTTVPTIIRLFKTSNKYEIAVGEKKPITEEQRQNAADSWDIMHVRRKHSNVLPYKRKTNNSLPTVKYHSKNEEIVFRLTNSEKIHD